MVQVCTSLICFFLSESTLLTYIFVVFDGDADGHRTCGMVVVTGIKETGWNEGTGLGATEQVRRSFAIYVGLCKSSLVIN